MEKEIVIKQAIIIGAILGVVFMSQQPFFGKIGKNLASQGSAALSGYISKGSNWVSSNLLSKLSGEVQKGGDTIQQGKENISKDTQNVSDKVTNYVSGVANSISGKNNIPECKPATTTKAKP